MLGPIFEKAIGDDWDPHIERIMGHGSIHPDQLPRWFELFHQTASEHCESKGAQALIDIAERMAQTLQIGLTREERKPQRS